MYTTTEELIELLDNRYGNPLAPDCKLIQQGIARLREQAEQIKKLRSLIPLKV